MYKKKVKLKTTRLFFMIFSIMFVVSLFASISVLAESNDLKLADATVSGKSDTVTGDITDVSNNKVEDDVTFHKVNDDITYKFVVKNTLDEEITILSITDDNDNSYVNYEYDKHENEKLGAGESFDFLVTTRYKSSVTDMSKRDQNTSTNFIINYTKASADEDDSSSINPNTGDNIGWSFIVLIISSTGLIACIVLDKKATRKKLSKMSMMTIIALMLTPIVVKALTLTYKIELVSNYGLYDKQVVTYTVNGVEKTLINQYGETITGLETPEEAGYTFEKWVYEDGSDFDPTRALTSDIKIIAKMNKITYSISYNLNGGSVSTANPTEYTVTDNFTLNEPTKEHYTFIGWTGTDLSEPTKNVVINSKTGNRSYTANYAPTDYTITYSGLTNAEKSALNNPTSYNIETNEFTLTNPQDRKDADNDVVETFVGWSDGTTTSMTITLPNTGSMGNKSYEAVWSEVSPTTYTITYELNGGTTSSSNPVEFTKNTETFTLINPTKVGYEFKGWSGTDLTGDENKEVKVVKGTKKNLSFEAHYTPISYQIKFEKNSTNVTGTMPNQTFEYGTESNLNEVAYTKEGYKFNGWNTEANGSGTHYADKAAINNLTTTKDDVIPLYAEWEANEYTIKLDSNAPTGSTATGEMADVSMVYDTPKTLPLNMYSVTGYTFDSWNTQANGTGTKIDNGSEVNNLVVSGETTLYAQWIANTYTIRFNNNTGSGSMEDLEMTYGQEKNLTKSAFTKEGYEFAGWDTEMDGSGTDYTDEQSVKNLTSINDGIVVLYAKWEANEYTIKLDANAPTGSTATGTMADVSMVYDTPKALPENAYSVTGYTFDSWNTKADGTGTKYNDKESVNNLVTSGTTTLFAQWAPSTNTAYTVIHKKMDLNGTTYTEAERDEKTGTTNSEVTPAVKEYDGFTSPSTKTVTIAADGSTVVEYFYTRNKYVLTINDSEYVEEDKSGEYFYESQVTITAKDREDYKFTGWSNGDSPKTTTLTITGNITVRPTYEYNVYIITLNPNGGGVTPSEIKVTKGEAVGTLPTPVKQYNDFAGWYTNLDFTIEVTEETVPSGNVTYFAKWTPSETPSLLCRKATTLHTTECPSTAACKNAGYTETGSRGTNIVTFGTIPHIGIEAGNAYDCDVNGDGTYDADTERFYYLTTKGENAVLMSHTNYEGEAGQVITENYPYTDALTKLPTKTTNQWNNVQVTFSNHLDSTDTNVYAARFATYDELKEATGKDALTAVGSLDDYAYLMENTQFVGVGRSGIWLESNPDAGVYRRIHSGTSNRNVTTSATTANVARPVIEVPLEFMDITEAANTYTVTFESNGGPSVDPLTIEKNTPLGTLPVIALSGYVLDGWYYEPEFTTKAKETDLVEDNIILYAKWDMTAAAQINDTYYSTLEAAIDAVPTTEEETVIKLLKDVSVEKVIAKNKNIILDLQNHTISNSDNTPILENNGYIVLKNGTFVTTSTGTGGINNNKDATMKLIDLTITSTGAKQALYNNGGIVEISGDSHFSNTSSNRAAVHNLNNGTMTIKSAEIIATAYHGVYNESGTLTIGEKDGVIDTTNPVIRGAKSGLYVANGQTFNFYDGIIKGKENAINTPSALDGKEEGSEIKNDTEVIDSVTYKTAIMYIEASKYKITFDADGGTVSPEYKVIEIGAAIGNLPTPTKGIYTFDGWFSEKIGGEEITSSYIPDGSMIIYARYHYNANENIVNFNMMSDAMNTYYSNLNTWLSDTDTFQANMDENFNNYNCSECTGPNYQACPTPAANKTLCEQSKGYAVGVEDIVVYESSEAKEKGSLVAYTTVKSGTIYNMIPDQVYYWESGADSNVHGYVKALGKRRTISSNVRNVRDLGGLEVDTDNDGTIDGTIKYGKMFRGAKLSSAASDVTELQKLGITEEVDLRGSSGDAKFSNYKGRAITNYLIYPDTYAQNYTVFRQALVDTMQDVINGENIYFHCAIGTDRTGTIAYFLEGLLGVSEEDRLEDYEISYFTGLLNRNRFHDHLDGSSINPRFTTMANTYKTNQSIYNYFMSGSTNATADSQLIEDFRTAVIDYS